MSLNIQSIYKFILTFALVVFSSAAFAGAAPNVSPGCDPDFLDVMESRAWLEGKREMEVAQRLIVKQDSVLEYSCFNLRLNEVGLAANTIFSDNIFSSAMFPTHPATAPRPPLGPPNTPQPPINLGPNYPNPPPNPPGQMFQTGLDNRMGMLVYTPMFEFLVTNFGHSYAGGTFVSAAPVTICNPMDAVWAFVKCQDFDIGHFRRFNHLALLDIRDLTGTHIPPNCNNTSRSSNWTSQLTAANPTPGSPGAVDTVVTYNNTIDYNSCSASPIETGITVSLDGATFPDAVCPNPACYYDGSGSCN